jgi:hypothetical protein
VAPVVLKHPRPVAEATGYKMEALRALYRWLISIKEILRTRALLPNILKPDRWQMADHSYSLVVH